MKSILYVLPTTTIGGAETKFYQVIMHTAGMRSLLLTNRAVGPYFEPLGISVCYFEDYGCHEPLPFSPGRTLAYTKAIAQVTRREEPDCLVGIMHTGLFYLSAARDLHRLKTACLGTIEGNITGYFDSEKRRPTLLERTLLRYLLSRVRRIVVPCEGVGRDLIEHFGVKEARIAVVYNGVDAALVRSRACEAAPYVRHEGKLVVTACRLDPQKDFLTLLRAFQIVLRHVEASLVIVGDGPLRGKIMEDAISLGIGDRVILTGFQENPFPYIGAADVFVLSSFFEGFGNVLVEAMALGVPVVSTDCPSGPGEVIEHRFNGLLVPVGDAGEMAAAMLLILRDSELSAAFRKNGPRRAESFSAQEMTEGFRRELARACSQ